MRKRRRRKRDSIATYRFAAWLMKKRPHHRVDIESIVLDRQIAERVSIDIVIVIDKIGLS